MINDLDFKVRERNCHELLFFLGKGGVTSRPYLCVLPLGCLGSVQPRLRERRHPTRTHPHGGAGGCVHAPHARALLLRAHVRGGHAGRGQGDRHFPTSQVLCSQVSFKSSFYYLNGQSHEMDQGSFDMMKSSRHG